MTDNGFVGNASHIYPRIVQPAPEATSDRDKMCQIISEAVGGWNQNTQAITRVAAALSAAGFGLVADAKAEALEEAAEEFESNVGVGEFAELSSRDGAYWNHINESWEHQGPYMDWLRNRAAALRGES